MHRLTAVVLSLISSAALACPGAPMCVLIAPGDRLNVPENAPAFVAPKVFDADRFTLRTADAGVRELTQFEDQGSYGVGLFAPGPIARGQLLILESTANTCGKSGTVQSVDVGVTEAAPFPSAVGEVVLGEPSGFVRPEGVKGDCTPEAEIPAVQRSVSVILPADALPWLSLMRVKVNGSGPNFGHLARSVTLGEPTLVGHVIFDCNRSTQVVTQPLVVELEIAGRAEVVRAESMVAMDCRVAPPPPSGCSSVPLLSLGVLAVWLARRRAQGR